MHPGNMISRHEAEWEDVLQTNKADEIIQKLKSEFPYDFHRAGSRFSFRSPMTIQVARGLSDNEYHLVLGFCKALDKYL